jgi:hypothetical protein
MPHFLLTYGDTSGLAGIAIMGGLTLVTLPTNVPQSGSASLNSHSESFDQRRRPETLRTAPLPARLLARSRSRCRCSVG